MQDRYYCFIGRLAKGIDRDDAFNFIEKFGLRICRPASGAVDGNHKFSYIKKVVHTFSPSLDIDFPRVYDPNWATLPKSDPEYKQIITKKFNGMSNTIELRPYSG